MAVSVVMPALEMAQETGKLVSWKKKEGEKVAKGEMLLEVETDKAVVEIEAPADGILGGVTAAVGDVVPVGQTIAWLLKPGEKPPAATAPTQTGRTMASRGRRRRRLAAAAARTSRPRARQISPKARRLAKEHGVDVSRLKGSGPAAKSSPRMFWRRPKAAAARRRVPAARRCRRAAAGVGRTRRR